MAGEPERARAPRRPPRARPGEAEGARGSPGGYGTAATCSAPCPALPRLRRRGRPGAGRAEARRSDSSASRASGFPPRGSLRAPGRASPLPTPPGRALRPWGPSDARAPPRPVRSPRLPIWDRGGGSPAARSPRASPAPGGSARLGSPQPPLPPHRQVGCKDVPAKEPFPVRSPPRLTRTRVSQPARSHAAALARGGAARLARGAPLRGAPSPPAQTTPGRARLPACLPPPGREGSSAAGPGPVRSACAQLGCGCSRRPLGERIRRRTPPTRLPGPPPPGGRPGASWAGVEAVPSQPRRATVGVPPPPPAPEPPRTPAGCGPAGKLARKSRPRPPPPGKAEGEIPRNPRRPCRLPRWRSRLVPSGAASHRQGTLALPARLGDGAGTCPGVPSNLPTQL